MSEPVGARATHGTVRRSASWSLLGQVFSNSVRFVSNLILSRIFADDSTAFGQIAIVAGANQLIQLFSDLGVWMSVVRSERGSDPVFLRTAWTVQVIRSLLLCAIGIACAPVFAWVYEDPRLTELIRISALGFAIDAFVSARVMLFKRSARLRPLVLIDLAAQIVGSCSTILLAWLWRDTMAMVVGGLCNGGLKLLLSRILPGPRDGFGWDRSALRELLRVGAWVFVNTFLMFLTTQDRLVYGTLVTQEELGFYYLAWTIASVPSTICASMSAGLLLPLVSAQHSAGGDLVGKVLRARGALLVYGSWVLSGLCAGGPLVADFLYPDSYGQVGQLLPLACLSLWWSGVVEQTRSAVLTALDHIPWNASGMLVKLVTLLVTVPLGHAWFGFHGAIYGYVIADLPRTALVHWLARNTGVAGLRQDLWFASWFAIATVVGIEARRLVEAAHGHYALGMAAVFLCVTGVWVAVSWRNLRRFWHDR